jgi:hypothetical protein
MREETMTVAAAQLEPHPSPIKPADRKAHGSAILHPATRMPLGGGMRSGRTRSASFAPPMRLDSRIWCRCATGACCNPPHFLPWLRSRHGSRTGPHAGERHPCPGLGRPDRERAMRSTPVLDDRETPELEVAAAPVDTSAGLVHRAGAFFLREFREMLPPTTFFFIGFNLIVLTTNLILADYSVAFASFMLATAAALVVGKSVLVANAMAVLHRYDRAPLIQPILFKTVFYWAIVFIARLIESFCRTWSRPFPGITLPRSRFGYWFFSWSMSRRRSSIISSAMAS